MNQIIKGVISTIEVDNEVFRVYFTQLDSFVTHPIKKRISDRLEVGNRVEVVFHDANYATGYITAKVD